MSKRKKRIKAVTSELSLNFGQILIFFLMLGGILSLGGWSIYNAKIQDIERINITEESNDVGSINYTQRDSFNVAIEFLKWYDGGGSYRSLQISRALLGQRLQVLTQEGLVTYSLMTESYKTNLSAIDQFIITGSDPEAFLTFSQNKDLENTLEKFLTDTRRVSRIMQAEVLKQVTELSQKKARSEAVQAIFLLFSSLMGAIFFLWVSRDLSKRLRDSRREIQAEKKKLESAVRMVEISKTLEQIQNELLGTPVEKWIPGQFFEAMAVRTEQLAPEAGLIMRNSDNLRKEVDLYVTHPEFISDGELSLIRRRVEEIVQTHRSRRRLQEEAFFRSTHDQLTGLLNLNGLSHLITEGTIATHSSKIAAIFFDIDRFHRINDSFGFPFGDQVLIQIATKLRTVAKPGEILVRLSSDEFLVISPVKDQGHGRLRALELQAGLEINVVKEDIDMNLTISAGVVMTDTATIEKIDLLHDGAIATSLAGKQPRSGFAFYTEALANEFVGALSEEFAIKQAIRNSEFVLYLQPVIGLSEGTIEGAETLIRWNRPGYGLIFPDEFLPKIRAFSLETELGTWVMNSALQIRANSYIFQSEFNIENFRIGVNIEAQELFHPDFFERYQTAFKRYGVDPKDFVLEVTEHVLATGVLPLEHLSKLHKLGTVIAIDDFGTGYSNLSQAQGLPLTILKIDKSFMPKNANSENSRYLIQDIHDIAKTLNLQSLAEGVETLEVEEIVKNLGVTYAQGFLYSPAIPERDFWNWVRRRTMVVS